MIFTDRKITIRNGKSSINEPVILYRGDYEVSITFTIMESKFRFRSGVNLVDSEKASHGQLAILAPYGGNVFSDVVKCEDGTVTFTLTKEMIDQLEEVGLYSFQIRLFDYYRESRVSIPPVEFGIEVREPVASEDHDNEVNNAIVGYSIAKVVDGLNEDVPDTFDSNRQYNKTNWKTGDRISEGKLNKIEDAIDKINRNEKADVAALDKRVTNNFKSLDASKADKNEIFSMANMGQDVKEAMTGGSVAVVGNNAILAQNIVDGQVTFNKRTRSSDSIMFVSKIPLNFDTKTRKLINKNIQSDFGLNHGDGHKTGAQYYFSELALPDNVGYIYINPKLSGSEAFIAPGGSKKPDDIENCILLGAYDFRYNYFYLYGIPFTVDEKSYIPGIDITNFRLNDLTGEIGTVFSTQPPNFNTTTNQLEINSSCGVGSRHGHFNNEKQNLNLTTNGYIGYDTVNKEYVMITNNNFTPAKDVLIVGYANPREQYHYLYGVYTIDGYMYGCKDYKTYTYSKDEIDAIVKETSTKASVKASVNNVLLYSNTFKNELSNFTESTSGVTIISHDGLKFNTENVHITHDNEYSIERRKTSINFILGQNGVLSFFYKTYEGYNLAGSLFTVDASNNKFILHEQFPTQGIVPAERVSMNYAFIVGRKYNLTMLKEKRKNIAILTDTVTCNSVKLETDCTAVIGDLINEFAGGRQNGRFGIWNRQGIDNIVSDLYITTNIKEPLLYMIGDSICEGDRCTIGKRYADLCEDALGIGNIAVSGMSGTTITGVMNRLQSELPYIKPKYCMVTIGTNGGNTSNRIQALIDYVKSLDIIPIINHVSQTSGTQANLINTTIDTFPEYVGCKFDIATSIDNDITKFNDKSLYGDSVHPNENGHAKMFERFSIDVPYIIWN